MNKIQLSYVFVVICFIVYVFSGFADLVETLCMVGFFVNGFYYTYTFDYLPKTEESLKSPSVFLYRRRRLNLFGYLNSGVFVGMTLIFFILQGVFLIKLGFIIFTCWVIMLLLFRSVVKYTQDKSTDEEILFEYMADVHQEFTEILVYLSENIPNYPSNDIDNQYFDSIYKILSISSFDKDQITIFINTYKELYVNLHTYSSDEVEAIDKNI